ncbi:hypothetical protein EI94DRAFT_1912347 [Lactarius quietus]|nr:hypothetical protein EI94DRAFT_1912347 [Lactarius quietus]
MEHDDELAPSQDTARANDEDTADLTPEEGCVDPDDIIDVDILEALMEDIDSSAAINPEQWDSRQSDHAQSTGSGSDDPVSPPSLHFEPGNSGGASPVVVETFSRESHIYHTSQEALHSSIWAPFFSQRDWEIACWAKMCGPTSSALADLLAIPEVVDRLGLSYRTPKELNEIIDHKLAGRPPFQCHELIVAGETLHFYFRDILQSVRCLFGDPEFVRDLVFTPERHYADNERSNCVYSEMHTGNWWWAVQTSLEGRRPGATVVPVIISSDKTQLTLFRGKMAYAVYLTIGNIPKAISQMLVAYIPTSRLEEMGNKAARRRALGNVYHCCMRKILALITAYGETGVAMLSSDGIWRRCHPILAAFVGDYPEQALVTCTYQGRCPKCIVPPEELGNYFRSPRRDYDEVLATFRLAEGDVRAFHLACHKADLKPVFHPFWEALPLVDIFISITPDILHQMLQGIMKHLIAWVTSVFGATIVDTRCKSMPLNHHITTFAKGITILSRVTGLEHKQMCKILLGLIIDLSLTTGESPARLIKSLPSHTSDTLNRLEDALARFHNNKDVFVDLGVRDHFHFPKIHSLLHYQSSITLFGTTDNYNTEQTEHLHMDYTKYAYRATNKKDEEPQMTVWNERREKVEQHALFVAWRQQAQQPACNQVSTPEGPPVPVPRTTQMALNPTLKAVSFNDIANKYGAWDFQDALTDFIARINHPDASTAALKDLAENTLLPFQTVPVYHKIKFVSTGDSEVIDTIHARPGQRDTHGRPIPSCFDTVIVWSGSGSQEGLRVAQVRVVFQLPSKIIPLVFPSSDATVPTHLVYVEWFSPIPTTPDRDSNLYKVSRLARNGRRITSVVPVDSILSSVHLFPRFGQDTPVGKSFSVLELCHSFYINPFSCRDTFLHFS